MLWFSFGVVFGFDLFDGYLCFIMLGWYWFDLWAVYYAYGLFACLLFDVCLCYCVVVYFCVGCFPRVCFVLANSVVVVLRLGVWFIWCLFSVPCYCVGCVALLVFTCDWFLVILRFEYWCGYCLWKVVLVLCRYDSCWRVWLCLNIVVIWLLGFGCLFNWFDCGLFV